MLNPNAILQNRYRIIQQLGQGGMGTVYEATDERLDTVVALKECHFTDERLRKQFEREARLLARLRHPAMTRVIDHFMESDGQFLVMDFIVGEDLWEMLQRNGGAFPSEEVLQWADQLLDALDYLHKQEPPIIHRDIKPQNLKLSNTGQIILLDFGLAKGFAGQFSRITTSGSILGYTPNYAPLEQIQGTGTDPRSDLYSLAASLYHLMTNVTPPDVLARAAAVLGKRSDPLRAANEINPQISAAVSNVLMRTMEIDCEQRLATSDEMRQALKNANQYREAHPSKVEVSLPPTFIKQPVQENKEAIASTIASPDFVKAHKQVALPTSKEVELEIYFSGTAVLIDSKVEVYLDEEYVGKGSLRKGFDLVVKTSVGTHILKLKHTVLTKAFYTLEFSSSGKYKAYLGWNSWAGFEEYINIQPERT